MNVGFFCWPFGAGLSLVFQQVVNANLRAEIGSPWWAGFISYLGGTLATLDNHRGTRTFDILIEAGRSSWIS
jgi:bacterial/archaeal transporter family-2 protein